MNMNDGYIAVPLHTNKLGLLDVSISLNGQQGKFHLDTGASMSCLDRGRVNHFALDTSDTEHEATGVGGAQKVSKVAIDQFMVDAHTVGQYDLHVIDLSHVNAAAAKHGADPIDGVLGNDFLRRYQAVIDYSTEAMYIKVN